MRGDCIVQTQGFDLYPGKHYQTKEPALLQQFCASRVVETGTEDDLGLSVALVRAASGVQSSNYPGLIQYAPSLCVCVRSVSGCLRVCVLLTLRLCDVCAWMRWR